MLSFFSSKKDNCEGISFLTTQAMSYHLEEMMRHAQKHIVIITPYLKIHSKLKTILEDKKKQGVKIIIVCRKRELKDTIEHITDEIVDNPNLHAKCYLTENCALIGSLNLYEFSQVNNDEMGVLFENRATGKKLYEEVLWEARRLYSPKIMQNRNSNSITGTLIEGEKYTLEALDKIFDFDYKGMSGIKNAKIGDIVLFTSSKSEYSNTFKDGILHYQGQNTGTKQQELIYGNADLYAAYKSQEKLIHLFIDFAYYGQVYVAQKPYLQNGKWYFPLRKKQ